MNSINNKKFAWIFIILSFTGFLDALYLSLKKIMSSPVNCYVFEGCQKVTDSAYANFFGIPISFFGVAFYLAVFFLSVRHLETENNDIFKVIFYLSSFGLIFAVYLVGIQAFVLRAFCLYCLLSAATSLFLFIAAFIAGRKTGFLR